MQTDPHQFQLRYSGARFDEHRLPVDVLADLPAFRDLVAAFAKQIWHQTHADRVRLPKGFEKGLAFDLDRIDPGSAMPALIWSVGVVQKELPEISEELSQIVDLAYGDVLALFDAAANHQFPKALSSEFIRPLNKLGAGLRNDEKIEFWGSKGTNGNVIYIDSHVRKSLITKVRETYEARFDGSGLLVGIDAPLDAPMATLRVRTNEYAHILIDVPRDRIKAEFDGHIDNPVQFEITVELGSEDQFRSVVAVHDIAIVEFPEGWGKFNKRLMEIGSLKDHWLDGKGLAISSIAIGMASSCVLSRPVLGPLVKAYPTETGGVLLEFEHGGWDLSLEFTPDGKAEIYGIEIDGENTLEPLVTRGLEKPFFSALDELLKFNDV